MHDPSGHDPLLGARQPLGLERSGQVRRRVVGRLAVPHLPAGVLRVREDRPHGWSAPTTYRSDAGYSPGRHATGTAHPGSSGRRRCSTRSYRATAAQRSTAPSAPAPDPDRRTLARTPPLPLHRTRELGPRTPRATPPPAAGPTTPAGGSAT